MKHRLHTILRLLLVFIPVLMVLAQARAQGDTVCVGSVSTWVVVDVPGDNYNWELYNDVENLNLAVAPGNCPASEAYFVDGVNTGDSVNVMCLQPGTYFIKVTATDTCTNNLKVGMIVVIGCESYAIFLDPDPNPICAGDTAMMTIEITGAPGPWDITYTDGLNIYNIDGIQTSPHPFQLIPTPTVPGNYEYWITSVTNTYGITNSVPSAPVTLIVKPKPVTSPIYRY